MNTRKRNAAVAIAAVALGVAVGGGAVAFAGDSTDSTPPKAIAREDAKMPDGGSAYALTKSWAKNKYGLTYGTVTLADRDAINIPDLTPATATNGEEGFIYTKEFIYPLDDQALERQKARLNDKGEDEHTVYGPDGKTVLGTTILGSYGQQNSKGEEIAFD